MKKERKYSILVALFVMALTLSALIGSKIIVVLGITFSASALTFPLTFLVTDVISEIWGKRRAKHIVMIGFATLIITVFISSLAVFLPGAQFWEGQDAYQQTLGIVGRIVLGGAIAYLVSQHHDVWAYHMLKEISKGKHL